MKDIKIQFYYEKLWEFWIFEFFLRDILEGEFYVIKIELEILQENN